MIKFMILLTMALQWTNSISLKQVKSRVLLSRTPEGRKLFMEEANMPAGNQYVEQLQSTNSNMNDMTNHSRRQTEMKQVGQWFSDVDERLDDFRDAVSRKLNELHMALQRPQMPMGQMYQGSNDRRMRRRRRMQKV